MGVTISNLGYSTNVLHDELAFKPNFNGIMVALNYICMQKCDTIIFYYAGHGVTIPRFGNNIEDTHQQQALLAQDSDGLNNVLWLNEICLKLKSARATNKILITDCCLIGLDGYKINIHNKERYQNNFGALYATRINEKSIELEELNHGLFTYNLLRILKQVSPISFLKLASTICNDVSKYNHDNFKQLPTYEFEGDSDIII